MKRRSKTPLSKALAGFYLALDADGYSKNTIAIYQWALSRMTNFLGDMPVEEITSTDLRRFFAWIQNDYVPTRMNGSTEKLTGRSVENVWTTMRSFYNHLVKDNLVDGRNRPDDAIRKPEGR